MQRDKRFAAVPLGLVDHVEIRHTVVSHQRICGMRADDSQRRC